MAGYSTVFGPIAQCWSLLRDGHRIGLLDSRATQAEADEIARHLTEWSSDTGQPGLPDRGYVHTSNGPTKPPYGTPERHAHDEATT